MKEPYARMKCPVPEQLGIPCTTGKYGPVKRGTVPGIKRHVIQVHGRQAHQLVDYPPIHKGGKVEPKTFGKMLAQALVKI